MNTEQTDSNPADGRSDSNGCLANKPSCFGAYDTGTCDICRLWAACQKENLKQWNELANSCSWELINMVKQPNNEQPYIEQTVTTIVRKYNPNYGDDRVCKCGHTYYRHFDTYAQMDPCGCKYCSCDTFEETNPKDDAFIEYLKSFHVR